MSPTLFGTCFTATLTRGYLPDYIRGLPQRLQHEDIDYLAAKRALTIPDVELRNQLLKSYIHYVHPYMPLLDLDEFSADHCAQ